MLPSFCSRMVCRGASVVCGRRSSSSCSSTICSASLRLAIVAVMAAASFAQTVETFYVNDGRNDLRDAPLGEFAPDLGGALSWERYSDNAPAQATTSRGGG